jgi:hypothetical protein
MELKLLGLGTNVEQRGKGWDREHKIKLWLQRSSGGKRGENPHDEWNS